MPTYDYQCATCRPFRDSYPMAAFADPQPCPACGAPSPRALTLPALAGGAQENAPPGTMETHGRKNARGPSSLGVPGNLVGWCEALARFDTFALADVMEPAIWHAARGFRVTPSRKQARHQGQALTAQCH